MTAVIRYVATHAMLLNAVWTVVRRGQFRNDYRERRERYAAVAAGRGLMYDGQAMTAAIRSRITARGWSARQRKKGDVHTFAFIPNIGWHVSMLPDLCELGPVSRYDYVGDGYRVEEFWTRSRTAVERRRRMMDSAIEAMRAAHRERPIDWAFFYASGIEIAPDFVRRVVDEFGVPVVNMCLDDKHSWSGPGIDGHRTGQIDLIPHFDLSWTSTRVACEWYLVEGGRPIYLPAGFSAHVYHPRDVPRDLDVSFVGSAYGFRASVVQYLRRHGVSVATFGLGWPGGHWVAKAADVFCRSAVNLGMGGIGYDEALTNLKGRDFEVPGCGGGVYLTTFNPDLAQHFAVGSEILCYANRDELLESIRHVVAHRDEAHALATRARERALREHRWVHRFEKVCRILGVLPEE
jgi:hypothetical protein